AHLAQRHVEQRVGGRGNAGLALTTPAAGGRCLRFHRQVIGHLVQPAPEGVALLDRAGPTRQDQERGLECVLSVLFVTQDAAADAQDEWSMPPNQRGESSFFALRGEALQELAV